MDSNFDDNTCEAKSSVSQIGVCKTSLNSKKNLIYMTASIYFVNISYGNRHLKLTLEGQSFLINY